MALNRPDDSLSSLRSLLSPYSFIFLGSVLLFFWSTVQQTMIAPGSSTASSMREVVGGTASSELYPHNLTEREFSGNCGPSNPCPNGACCGQSGYCGYGPTYCGKGCTSNCGAKAECGKFASPSGKTCPLNTCCSQFGFCGTTKDFCATKCQSNCDLNPKPPAGSPAGKVFQRVIGYYETWAASSTCHQVAPEDLPLQVLTHVNVAFAYIDPHSYELVPMDQTTPAALFSSATALKQYKSTLSVFISVGGWTFSDNKTATQPLFGHIASSEGNRQKFADNVLAFVRKYAFDGIDLDWEYPGAPDRGGNVKDTANYVALLKTLRKTFDTSSRKLGITFTAPSSYWYLRWFDLPGMLQSADWMNYMTYDLHGSWDADNPIGAIVQGHTNLTEINLALELLWRMKVEPAKVSMAFGFYGRSFELADPKCTHPGCPFKQGGSPGPCSNTQGILEYYEIQALLNQQPHLQVIHDKTAAVKYVTYDKNQWVSFDDKDTFKQKADFANKIGIGGSLIWASDADDDNYSAHSNLLNEDVAHMDLSVDQFAQPDAAAIAEDYAGHNGQNCYQESDCSENSEHGDLNGCKSQSGMIQIGWEKGKCGNGFGHSICCPVGSAPNPKTCQWRGDTYPVGDCDGVCHTGEIKLFGSSYGGYPREAGSGTNKCSRGGKQFCCQPGDWSGYNSMCRWAADGGHCNQFETTAAFKWSQNGVAFDYFCCKKPSPFYDCVWRGKIPDCAADQCLENEVTVDQNRFGDAWGGCSWGRLKSLCCKANTLPPPPLQCDEDSCQYDPGSCDDPDYGASDRIKRDSVDSAFAVFEYATSPSLETRDLSPVCNDDFDNSTTSLSERGNDPAKGNSREYSIIVGSQIVFVITSRPYPRRGRLFCQVRHLANHVLRTFFNLAASLDCDDTEINQIHIPDPDNLPDGGTGETEHPIDLDVHQAFIMFAINGILPSGRHTNLPVIPWTYLDAHYMAASLPRGLRRVTDESPEILEPEQRVWEAWGSNTNRDQFLLLRNAINNKKGKIFGNENPVSEAKFKQRVRASAFRNSQNDTDHFLQDLREVFAVFTYLGQADVRQRFLTTRDNIRSEFALIGTQINLPQLPQLWDEFFPDFVDHQAARMRQWLRERIEQARNIFQQAAGRLGYPPFFQQLVLTQLQSLEDQIDTFVHIPGGAGSKKRREMESIIADIKAMSL